MSDSDGRGRPAGAKAAGSSGKPRDTNHGQRGGRSPGSGHDRRNRAGRGATGRSGGYREDSAGGRRFPNGQHKGRRLARGEASARDGWRNGGGREGAARRGPGKQTKQDPDTRHEAAAKVEAPPLDDDIEFTELDIDVRKELRSLPKPTAELVGKHLVAAGRLIDTDPEAALAHARYVKTKASRIPVVREAVGLAAYHAGEWAEALSELRAVRRMTNSNLHVAVLADLERALGRPERALDLARETDMAQLPPEVAVELRIVAAGARRDLGQLEAAVVALQGPDLDPDTWEPWSARLFYAYADNLLAAGRKDEAVTWFMHAAEADIDDETDAAERVTELTQ